MTVAELIEGLQKLPQNDVIEAEVLGDNNCAKILGVRVGGGTHKAFSFITIDRTEEVEMQLNFISDMRSDYEGDYE